MKDSRSLHSLIDKWRARSVGHPPSPDEIGPDREIVNLVEHTNAVVAGSCFFALVRANSDGHPYIGKALALGASVIVGERPQMLLDVPIPADVTYLQVANANETLAWMSAAWHDFPADELTVIGITGTNGKTTTIAILFEIMRTAGLKTGLISTIKAVFGENEEPTGLHVTTPAAPDLQHYLRRMVDAGLTHCILETTSHGLALYRVAGVSFDIGAITNITHEHIDYHHSFENYRAAKRMLFELVSAGQSGRIVLNRDDLEYSHFASTGAAHPLTYGIESSPSVDLTVDKVTFGASETRFQLVDRTENKSQGIKTTLVGQFNLYNILCAAGVTRHLDIDLNTIAQGVAQVGVISGRMERIDMGQSFLTIVDFAHTPDALIKVIDAAKEMLNSVEGRIITVFGSAGKRDVEKRRLMAEASARLADITILTAEDPRNEALDTILEMMAEGCRSQGGVEGETFFRVPDRGRAIYFALTQAKPEDILLICGKGHEQSMCFGTTEYPWDDRDATRAALTQWLSGAEMSDLGLPTF